ncbi:MAG: hypothetical protein V3T31_08205, partial [candidate division Zixibacteria bacterium]
MLYPRIYDKFLRLKASLKGSPHYILLDQLRTWQWLPQKEIAALQLEQLRLLIEFAQNNSEFY